MEPIIRPLNRNGLCVMTYNILAQTLIRRERFPCSGNTLKWSVRHTALLKEIDEYKPDLLCMQEVDATKEIWWTQELKKRGLETVFFKKEARTHGLLAAYSSKFTLLDKVQIEYDSMDIPFQALTGNVALILKLNINGTPTVFATTHLFWRPTANYERLRQMVLLMETINKQNCKHIIVGADTNSAPWSPAYQLILNNGVTPKMHEQLVESVNGRQFEAHPDFVKDPIKMVEVLVDRANKLSEIVAPLQSSQLKFFNKEPSFTNWTPDYRDTLDYIFVAGFDVTSSLDPVETKGLFDGMPFWYEDKTGYPSDHIPVVVCLGEEK